MHFTKLMKFSSPADATVWYFHKYTHCICKNFQDIFKTKTNNNKTIQTQKGSNEYIFLTGLVSFKMHVHYYARLICSCSGIHHLSFFFYSRLVYDQNNIAAVEQVNLPIFIINDVGAAEDVGGGGGENVFIYRWIQN